MIFKIFISRKADVLYTIDVTYSHIFMNLVTNMRWGGQGVVEVVFLTRKTWRTMVLILLREVILVHRTRHNQLAPPVLKLCPLIVHGIQAQPVQLQCQGRACMNHTSLEATIMMPTSSNSSTLASNYQHSIQTRVKGWRKGTAQVSNGLVECWWISTKTGLLQFNEVLPGCVPALPCQLLLYFCRSSVCLREERQTSNLEARGLKLIGKILCLKAIHSWLFVFTF